MKHGYWEHVLLIVGLYTMLCDAMQERTEVEMLVNQTGDKNDENTNRLVMLEGFYSSGNAGTCINAALWCCRKPIGQCQCSFYLKAVLPLVKMLAAASYRNNEAGLWVARYNMSLEIQMSSIELFSPTHELTQFDDNWHFSAALFIESLEDDK